jgi:phenylalanyl-tRNA synthetase beta chain
MNISYNWLRQYIDFECNPNELAVYLTGCGLEVESIEPFESIKGGLKGLIVGEVLETSKHPNADKLTLCKVAIGSDVISQIVCGAPNVAAGQKVIVALPGTTIYPLKGEPFEIKKSKIRGEESAGMLCAEDEIGMGESHEGLLILKPEAVVGEAVSNYFHVENDFTLSIGLTPNRPDAASHIGVARDLKAVLNALSSGNNIKEKNIKWPDVSSFNAPQIEPVIKVRVESEACGRYSGVHIVGVKVTPSPTWLQNKLLAAGLNPINNIVDITNFVLFELGQPLHAFDAAKINHKEIIVKQLPKGTTFKTLDGVDRKLEGTELMICDNHGGLCMAGVFGGMDSGVSSQTTEIFLESAWFDAVSIRKTSKLHGLKTDASFRFERGTDPDMTMPALKRAALMICDIAGGSISSEVIDVYPHPVSFWKLEFQFDNFQKLTGVDIPKKDFIKILNSLDIKIAGDENGILQLEIPPYRVDVMREADVVEEVLRIYGYDRIPLPAKLFSSLPMAALVPLEKMRNSVASMLTANGFTEVMCNSLYRSSVYNEDEQCAARIKNPLSQDLDTMRINMLYPLLDTTLYNSNRKRGDLRIFEYGKTYHKNSDAYSEINHLALLLSGKRNAPHWMTGHGEYSIYWLKAIIDNVLTASGVRSAKLKWEPVDERHLESAMLFKSGKKEIARIGLVRKKVLKKFDLDGAIYFADVNLDQLERIINTAAVKISEPPKFPEVQRDLSMVLDKSVQYQSLEDLAFETERKILRDVNLFDVYEGEKIGEGKKSYALSFTLRDDEKTLTEKDIDKVMQRLMENFEKKLGAGIRKG